MLRSALDQQVPDAVGVSSKARSLKACPRSHTEPISFLTFTVTFALTFTFSFTFTFTLTFTLTFTFTPKKYLYLYHRSSHLGLPQYVHFGIKGPTHMYED